MGGGITEISKQLERNADSQERKASDGENEGKAQAKAATDGSADDESDEPQKGSQQ